MKQRKPSWPRKAFIQILIFLTLYKISTLVLPPADSMVYRRQDYKHWIDEDHDGLNTRSEVLIEESLIPVTLSENGASVLSGLWVDPYTGDTNTDPKNLDIDHLVPLKNAHISGAWKWSAARKSAFANALKNPEHLIAVSRRANRQKGAKAPHLWLPPNSSYRCAYISNWIEIKKEWGLAVEPETLSLWSNCQAENGF